MKIVSNIGCFKTTMITSHKLVGSPLNRFEDVEKEQKQYSTCQYGCSLNPKPWFHVIVAKGVDDLAIPTLNALIQVSSAIRLIVHEITWISISITWRTCRKDKFNILTTLWCYDRLLQLSMTFNQYGYISFEFFILFVSSLYVFWSIENIILCEGKEYKCCWVEKYSDRQTDDNLSKFTQNEKEKRVQAHQNTTVVTRNS